jgi:hypothetical protein
MAIGYLAFGFEVSNVCATTSTVLAGLASAIKTESQRPVKYREEFIA